MCPYTICFYPNQSCDGHGIKGYVFSYHICCGKNSYASCKTKKWLQMIRKCAAPEAELQQKVVSARMLHQWLRRHYCTRPVAETARKLSMQKS